MSEQNLDSELKFSKHIETQVSKANKILGLVKRSFEYLDAESMKLLFTGLITILDHTLNSQLVHGAQSMKKTNS